MIGAKEAGKGFKIYCLCSGAYLWDFLFTSKAVQVSELKSQSELGFSAQNWKISPTHRVVIQLAKTLPTNNTHTIYVDNFFTHAKLAGALR